MKINLHDIVLIPERAIWQSCCVLLLLNHFLKLLCYNTQLLCFSLLEFSQNVGLSEQKCFLVAKLDLGSSVFWKENLVTRCQCGGVHGSGHIHLSRANSDDFSFVGVLGRIGGENNSTGGRGLLGSTLDQDAVGEGLEFAKNGLSISMLSNCRMF